MAATTAKTDSNIDTEPTNTPDEFSYKHATFDEVLEDLSSRFILNLPEDELTEVERVCFQVEQAHWYYEDFIRDENPSFPSLPLKKFSEILFRSCPLLQHWSHDHETAFNGFMSYKTRVPVCGAIMLNESLTKCVLVKGWKSSAGWGFPKGKVNEKEDEAFCAVREVLEETGYNLSGQIRRTDCIRLCIKQQPITLFVVAGVPEEFPFKTQTRKEISKIDWFKLADLPTWKKNRPITSKFYIITPVIGPLKAIVRNLRRMRKETKSDANHITDTLSIEEEGELEADEADTTATVESPVIEREAYRGQCEAEISSSQSSSIDPHTPSVNGDLGPAASSGDKDFIKPHYHDIDDLKAEDGNHGIHIDQVPSSFNIDQRTHWSRLMTRLNHSQETSPQTTPQASTPTASVTKSPPKPEPQPPNGHLTYRSTAVPEVPKDGTSRWPPTNTPMSPSSLGSEQSRSTTSLAPRARDINTNTALSTSPEQSSKRTRQVQLLESVVAESSTRTRATLPLSAHPLGTFPRSSSVLIPDQIRTPLRSASVDPEASRGQLPTYRHHHHHLTQTEVTSPFSGLLPGPLYGHSSQISNKLPSNMLGPRRPSQLDLAQRQPHTGSKALRPPFSLDRNPSLDFAHKGQMLSILSGGTPAAMPGAWPAPTVSPHNSHLLSILNNPSPSFSIRNGPTRPRQLQGG